MEKDFLVSGEHLRKLRIFLPKFCTKILWYWSVHSCHLQTASVSLWRNSWISPSTLHLHCELCSTNVQCLPYHIMARFLCASQVPLPLSSLCKMLIASVGSSHVSYIFILKCFLSSFMLLHAKRSYFKTLWIYKTPENTRRWHGINSHLM